VSTRVLLVFLKHPETGTVKTRLAPALGPETAAELYRALCEEVLDATVPGPGEYERLVFFAPPEAAEAVRAWLPGLRLLPQVGEDLGARMSAAFDQAFEGGAERVAIVGTDSPALSRATVAEALDALDRADVVLGPAEDGGYYLLALRQPRPELFEGMPWSTPAVLGETLARAKRGALRVHQLGRRGDIDTPADLQAEWPRVRRLLESRPELRRQIEEKLSVLEGSGRRPRPR
jgi:rSAM/selenodomain-associated transferase 1